MAKPHLRGFAVPPVGGNPMGHHTTHHKETQMYIGVGALLLILLILAVAFAL
jgi:hypothetical protein